MDVTGKVLGRLLLSVSLDPVSSVSLIDENTSSNSVSVRIKGRKSGRAICDFKISGIG